MKETEIKIRINSELKNKFKNKCKIESLSMSDKIVKFINDDINFITDGIYLSQEKSIRILLTKIVLNKVLTHELFQFNDKLKTVLENTLKENLSFETVVSDVQYNNENNMTYGSVFFYLEDRTPYNIDFTVIANEN
jgi:antitoxin component of RelBE/YafQ-DinJ toxin-antitoxin module